MDKLQSNNTDMFHIYFSLASACFAWLLFVKPLTTVGPGKNLYFMLAALIGWCFIVPLVMIFSDSVNNSISGEDSFVIVKLLSLVVAIIVIQGFIAKFYYTKTTFGGNFKIMTIVINVILMVNIAEACYTQFKNYTTNTDQKTVYNIINPIIGIGLIVSLIINVVKGPGMRVVTSGSNINLFSDLKPWFILAYSFWNVLFRVHLLPNTSTVLFLVVSIILPIVADFAKWGDWLQVRAITLLFIMVVTFGLTNGEGSIVPIYNSEGYNKVIDDENTFSKIQRNDAFKYTLLVLGGLSLVMSFKESWSQKKTLINV